VSYLPNFCTGFEEDDTGKFVRCLICSETDPHGKLGSWIARTSMKNHAKSDGHATQVLRKAERDAQKSTEESQRRRLNEGPSAQLTSIFSQPTSSRRTGMFDNSNSLGHNWDIPASHSPNFPPRNPELLVPTGVTLLSDNTAGKQQELEQQYQELLRQAEHIDEFGEDDDSFDFNGGRDGKGGSFLCSYRLFDSLCGVGLVDVPEPEDIAEYFSNLPTEKDYFPYPNKLVSWRNYYLSQR